jgi:hypothetical protein
MRRYSMDKISADKFAETWKEELEFLATYILPNFAKNFSNQTRTFTEWIKIWVAWSELSSDEDIEMFYGYDIEK